MYPQEMALNPGTRLGPYEVLAQIGKGGMGEVYRAKDDRLGREVAIKVLRSRFSHDRERLHRFELEARAVGMLNHPNVVTIFEVGAHEGQPYVVSELLEGETLYERMKGGVPPLRKALDYALQVARGLAAAHEKGIVHRDIKPENIFITKDGRAKVLDFGLAKLTQIERSTAETLAISPDAPTLTQPGTVLGTLYYMSPEQAKGSSDLDHRSDIFSFGAVLYEMLTGRRPFQGDSPIEIMSAIVKKDPPELSPEYSPALNRIVRHCLEKRPEERFQSASDLAFGIEALIGETHVLPALPAPAPRPLDWRYALIGITALLIGAAGAFWAGTGIGRKPVQLSSLRLTFGQGTVWSARFAPDGKAVVYSASWEGNPVQLFWTLPNSPGSRSLQMPGMDILALSPSGEMALLFKGGSSMGRGWKLGTLAQAPQAGGAPREVEKNVDLGDWSPAGPDLAVARDVAGKVRVEFPMGKRLYETADRVGALRVSPSGNQIAIAEHPPGLGGAWTVGILDRSGKKKTLSSGWPGDFIDLAWSPDGGEIWFDTRQGGDGALHGVSLSGVARTIARLGVDMQLFDVAHDGRVLVGRTIWRGGILGVPPGDTLEERDLSWLDASEVDDVSYDGRALLITEIGEGGGIGSWSVYLRTVSEPTAVRLGDGQGFALSPDGTRALAVRRLVPPQLVLWPVGAGDPIFLRNQNITDYSGADWLPDGKHIVFSGAEKGMGTRCYVQDIEGGDARAITPVGFRLRIGQRAVSPDGGKVAAAGPDGTVFLFPIGGGERQSIPGLSPGDVPIRWSTDERSLFVFRDSETPPRIYQVDLTTGKSTSWKPITPRDLTGIIDIRGAHIGPDEQSYYYSYTRNLSDLEVLEGLR